MIDLERQGDIFILHMNSGENRFNPQFIAAFNGALDEVEASTPPAALVTTAEGKFYSNGLDLDWMTGEGREQAGTFLPEVHALFARVLSFPSATVAALNGHAFAGGAMLALAHDFRVMRSDRGYLCLPEVDLGLPFTPGMNALICARLPQPTLHEAAVTGRRYGAEDALAGGMVDETATEAEVVARAADRAKALAAKDGSTMAKIKQGLYAEALSVLRAAE